MLTRRPQRMRTSQDAFSSLLRAASNFSFSCLSRSALSVDSGLVASGMSVSRCFAEGLPFLCRLLAIEHEEGRVDYYLEVVVLFHRTFLARRPL